MEAKRIEGVPRGRAVKSTDPRKAAIVGLFKAATGCTKVTLVCEPEQGVYQAHCLRVATEWEGEGSYEIAIAAESTGGGLTGLPGSPTLPANDGQLRRGAREERTMSTEEENEEGGKSGNGKPAARQAEDYQMIPRSLIKSKDSDNVREVYEGIEELADEIKRDGLHQPIGVHPSGKGYQHVFGFRRLRAMDLLGWTEIPCHVLDLDEEKADLAQLVENLQRRNLTTYEQATGFQRQMEAHGWSAERLSKHISESGATGSSKSHIGNLTRCLKELAPAVKKEWAQDNPALTTHHLFKMASLEKDEQRGYMEVLLGGGDPNAKPEPETEGGNGEGSGDGDGAARAKRPSETKLAEALVAIRECEQPDAWKDGAIAALKYALGKTKGITGAFKPAKKKAAKKAEDEAAA